MLINIIITKLTTNLICDITMLQFKIAFQVRQPYQHVVYRIKKYLKFIWKYYEVL